MSQKTAHDTDGISDEEWDELAVSERSGRQQDDNCGKLSEIGLADVNRPGTELTTSTLAVSVAINPGILLSVAEDETIPEDGKRRRKSSVACQTEWSWLMCLHRMKTTERARAKNTSPLGQSETNNDEQELASKVEKQRSNKEASSRNKQARSTDAVKEMASKSAGDVDVNTEQSEVADSLAWPSREDEYGIPVVSQGNTDHDDWSSDESIDEVHEASDQVAESDDKKEVIVSFVPDLEKDDTELSDLVNNTCSFCGQMIKPFPSVDDQSVLPPEQLYCCSDYQEFIIANVSNDQELDNIGHVHLNSLSRRRGTRTHHEALNGDLENMETINYQLSARQCLTAGWTLRSVSPLFTEVLPDSVEEPVQHRANITSQLPNNPSLVVKTYQNGSPFLAIFPDGTGNVFYPSGRVAISIFLIAPSMFSWCVHQDVKHNPEILGLFDSRGSSAVYYPNGLIRLSISPRGGVELNSAGGKRHCWKWNDKMRHVHAPPLYSLNVPLSRHIFFQVNSWNDMILTFSAGNRACRFNVAARKQLPVINDVTSGTHSDIFEDNEEFRKKTTAHFQSVLEKTASLLRLPSVGRLPVLPTPRPSTSRSVKGQTSHQKTRTFVTV